MNKEKLYEVILIFLLVLSLFISLSLAVLDNKTSSIESKIEKTI